MPRCGWLPPCLNSSALLCCAFSCAQPACVTARAPLPCPRPAGAQLYSMYVGEGEGLLREAFRRARLAAPSILFLDELDSLVGRRAEGQQTGEAAARILSSFLTEMDGLEAARGVLVLGATNRPHALDAALVRCGSRCAAPVLCCAGACSAWLLLRGC